jgi:hypothetical protein
MSAPLHRLPDARVPLITAIVSGAALLLGTIAVALLATGI